jgi:hypothetical protein
MPAMATTRTTSMITHCQWLDSLENSNYILALKLAQFRKLGGNSYLGDLPVAAISAVVAAVAA